MIAGELKNMMTINLIRIIFYHEFIFNTCFFYLLSMITYPNTIYFYLLVV
jgi:hypothetical protein